MVVGETLIPDGMWPLDELRDLISREYAFLTEPEYVVRDTSAVGMGGRITIEGRNLWIDFVDDRGDTWYWIRGKADRAGQKICDRDMLERLLPSVAGGQRLSDAAFLRTRLADVEAMLTPEQFDDFLVRYRAASRERSRERRKQERAFRLAEARAFIEVMASEAAQITRIVADLREIESYAGARPELRRLHSEVEELVSQLVRGQVTIRALNEIGGLAVASEVGRSPQREIEGLLVPRQIEAACTRLWTRSNAILVDVRRRALAQRVDPS